MILISVSIVKDVEDNVCAFLKVFASLGGAVHPSKIPDEIIFHDAARLAGLLVSVGNVGRSNVVVPFAFPHLRVVLWLRGVESNDTLLFVAVRRRVGDKTTRTWSSLPQLVLYLNVPSGVLASQQLANGSIAASTTQLSKIKE